MVKKTTTPRLGDRWHGIQEDCNNRKRSSGRAGERERTDCLGTRVDGDGDGSGCRWWTLDGSSGWWMVDGGLRRCRALVQRNPVVPVWQTRIRPKRLSLTGLKLLGPNEARGQWDTSKAPGAIIIESLLLEHGPSVRYRARVRRPRRPSGPSLPWCTGALDSNFSALVPWKVSAFSVLPLGSGWRRVGT